MKLDNLTVGPLHDMMRVAVQEDGIPALNAYGDNGVPWWSLATHPIFFGPTPRSGQFSN